MVKILWSANGCGRIALRLRGSSSNEELPKGLQMKAKNIRCLSEFCATEIDFVRCYLPVARLAEARMNTCPRNPSPGLTLAARMHRRFS